MMIEWFTVVFGEPKEQAKLFTIVISTMLALTILLLNQWFINRRAKKDRLIVKLEELTTAVNGIASSGYQATKSLLVEQVEDDNNIDTFKKLMWEVSTLRSLYFQRYLSHNNKLPDILDMLIVARDLRNKKHTPGYEVDRNELYVQILNKLNDWFDETKTILDELTKKHIT